MPLPPSARIAVLGAGPTGLEVALTGRSLGYDVAIYERGETVAANILQWGHVPLFTPFGMNATPLGIATISATEPTWQPPNDDNCITGAEFHRRYLTPLANSKLLAESLHLRTEVLSVGRSRWLKSEGVGNSQRSEDTFRILLRDGSGAERIVEADVVIDCTGTFGNHNWLGQGGVPAVGELNAQSQIEYGLPDLMGKDHNDYLGKHTLVIGAGYSAATVVTQLANFSREHQNRETRATWITRKAHSGIGPISRIPDDRLASRDELAKQANQLAAESDGPVDHVPGTTVSAVEYRSASDDFFVELSGERTGEFLFDRIIANVGYRPDNRIYAELQVHECYAIGGPMKLAAQLLSRANEGSAVDCLDQTACGPESLANPEPNFYILGGKSYGRGSQFLLAIGYEQVRDLFTLITGREDFKLKK